MTTDVLVWRRPARDPIYVIIPHPECEADNCHGARKADMVLFDQPNAALHLFQVCAWHLHALRGRAPVSFFPLNRAPALEYIAQLIQQELARRQPVFRPTYGNTYGNMTFAFTTGTATGSWGYR